MKKIFLIFLIFLFSIVQLFSAEYVVPSGWNLKDKFVTSSVKLYQKASDDFYVVAVNMNQAKIEFGGNAGYFYTSTGNKFYTDTISNYYYKYRNYVDIDGNTYNNLFSVINGQFFDNNNQNTTSLSFPLKSKGIILNSFNGETNLTKRSLLINTDGKTYIREGFNDILFNSNSIKEYVVGLNPAESKNRLIGFVGRNYIAGIPDGTCDPIKTSCEYKYLLFFINKYSSQSNMETEIAKWGVPSKSIIMMDGSGSTQLQTSQFTLYGYIVDKRKLPNTFLIYGK